MRRIEMIRLALMGIVAVACAIVLPRVMKSDNKEIEKNFTNTLIHSGTLVNDGKTLMYTTTTDIQPEVLRALLYFSEHDYYILIHTK